MKIRINRAKLYRGDLVNYENTRCCPIGFMYRKFAKKKIKSKSDPKPYEFILKKFKVPSLYTIWSTNDSSFLDNKEKEQRIIAFCKQNMGLDVEYYGSY